jgi:hypothetical protein
MPRATKKTRLCAVEEGGPARRCSHERWPRTTTSWKNKERPTREVRHLKLMLHLNYNEPTSDQTLSLGGEYPGSSIARSFSTADATLASANPVYDTDKYS